jgi:ParB family chromosome partitioning protein
MSTFKRNPFAKTPIPTRSAEAAAATAEGDERAGKPSDLGARQDFRDKVGQVVEVLLPLVQSNPVNPRAHYPATSVDEIASTIRETGQIVAAQGFPSEDGQRVILIDGERRLRGCRAAGVPTLRIELVARPRDNRALYEGARAANVERSDQTALDDAIRWKQLLEQRVYASQVEIAKALGLDEGTVSRTLALATLPEPIVLILVADHQDMLSLRMLTALREFFDVRGMEETIDLIHEAARAGFGYREVNARRLKAQTGKQHRARAEQTPLKLGDAKGVMKINRVRGDVQLQFKGIPPDMLAALEAKVQEFLATVSQPKGDK